MIQLKSARTGDDRTHDQILEHYTIEKSLAARLRTAAKDERRVLYTAVYDELFERVAHHPLLTQKLELRAQSQAVEDKLRFLQNFLSPDATFLEIGPGDCSVSFAVAPYVKRVYAVDVSHEITRHQTAPANFELIVSDGCSIPVPAGSVQVAYSNQLMEHLHPDDAVEQLENLYRAMAPGGIYICITPNRLSGPHDVSKYFDDTATGLHLKEYTTTELAAIFRQTGYRRVRPFVWVKGRLCMVPLSAVVLLEGILRFLPLSIRRGIARWKPINRILSRVIATK